MALHCNLDAVLDRVDGDRELLAQMAQLVLAELDDLATAIRDALEDTDGPRLARSAHRLKGTVGNFEVERIFDLAYQLERAGAQQDFETAHSRMMDLESHLEEFRDLLTGLARDVGE